VELLLESLQINHCDGLRNANLEELVIEKESFYSLEETDQQRLLEPVPIDYIAVDKEIAKTLLAVFYRKRKISKSFNLPHELISNILQYLCKYKWRRITLCGHFEAATRLLH